MYLVKVGDLCELVAATRPFRTGLKFLYSLNSVHPSHLSIIASNLISTNVEDYLCIRWLLSFVRFRENILRDVKGTNTQYSFIPYHDETENDGVEQESFEFWR